MPAPIDVKIPRPSAPDAAWLQTEPRWVQLNADAQGHPEFYPLTIKFGFVFGIIYGQFESADALRRSPLPLDVSLFPAYGLCAAGVELLGRCLNGSDDVGTVGRDLLTGFNWLAATTIDTSGEDRLIFETDVQRYTGEMLVQLRHFASHGQAMVRGPDPTFDPALLDRMPELMGTGLQNYWWQLNNSDDFCEKLAKANILPIRHSPILRAWILFQGDGRGESIESVYSRFDWSAVR